ncbi:late expression factor 4 [Neodiprion abietis nucleopolyhedrovirus]|uniref:Late expression factor 4 n=1 Tax=Neodiprion abietis nucleopolyhedrovirus TaxID=204507 RepID=Q0ZP18_9CBAC|nr:late expression factor 4 [Neodiprion abietis nucleopolyhedrovirus]ABC74936.1 late expression factor 4 [Neodiprion abietis nucleopolyhedrovirus]
MEIEREIKYELQCDQKRAYDIYKMVQNDNSFEIVESYTDIRDSGNNRTRLMNESNDLSRDLKTIKKKVTEKNVMTYIHEDWIMHMSNTTSIEEKSKISGEIYDICRVNVYRMIGFSSVEIKFEEIFMNRSRSCYNGIHGNNIVKTLQKLNTMIDDGMVVYLPENNVRIGSDEIMLRIRVELEYEYNNPSEQNFAEFSEVVKCLLTYLHKDIHYTLHVAHDEMFNKIKYRNFKKTLLSTQITNGSNYEWYAKKLDGIRCKGITLNSSMRTNDNNFEDIQILYILGDDRKFYTIKLDESLTSQKNVSLGLQLEQINNELFYITDILTIFIVDYNNVTQYNLDHNNKQDIDLRTALTLLPKLHDNKHVKIQRYYKDCLSEQNVYNYETQTIPTDGLIAVTSDYELHKIKYVVTYELMYKGNNIFTDRNDKKYKVVLDVQCNVNSIYECVVTHDVVTKVVKERNDRYFPDEI